MKPQRWAQVQNVFDAAVEMEPGPRAAYLDTACGNDADLRREVESLLEAHQESDEFLDGTAPGIGRKGGSTRRSGDRLHQYQILSLLGAGGMGEVYLAVDTRLRRRVALKLLPRNPGYERDQLLRFQQEARAASALSHPNVCVIYEINETENGDHYIAMEHVAGLTLRERLSKESIPIEEALEVARQLASALSAAHQAGIVHRDIKPENIMLRPDGLVKVLDFGVAKLYVIDQNTAAELSILHTQPGVVVGTFRYMSPEQARGSEVDARADLWSLGVVLREMLTGSPPFLGATQTDVLVAILTKEPVSLSAMLPNVAPRLEEVDQRLLAKDPLARYQSAEQFLRDLELIRSERIAAPSQHALGDKPEPHKPHADPISRMTAGNRATLTKALILSAIALSGALILWSVHFRSRPKGLTEKDTVVLADFANTTGNALFDDTLKQGLSVSLSQSPFLKFLSDEKVADTLKLMSHVPSDRITPEIAKEICLRTNNRATLAGSISTLGSHYVIGLKASDCHTGDILAVEQAEAASSEELLRALDKAALSLRTKLGESLRTVEKYNAPLEEATTASLEALQAYSRGKKAIIESGGSAPLPMLKRAVELDPHFAIAYCLIGITYSNLDELGLANENFLRAFQFRERASENEKYLISAVYYDSITGELEKAKQVYEQWAESYPREYIPRFNLANLLAYSGEYDKALPRVLDAIRLYPDSGAGYANLMGAYLAVGRLSDVKATYDSALSHNHDYPTLHFCRYSAAFLERDVTEMQHQYAWAQGRPGAEDVMLSMQSDTESYKGHAMEARSLSAKAAEVAKRNEQTETASLWLLNAALRDAEVGNSAQSRQQVQAALLLAANRNSQILGALALARAGETNEAQRMAADLAKRFPLNTLLNNYWLPAISGAIALRRGDAERAIQALAAASSYELGTPVPIAQGGGSLYPVYIRGEGYLKAGQGGPAAVEFKKIIDHPFILQNFVLRPLAYLGLARAKALIGDKDGARTAYNQFFNLWEHADPDIPVLREAKVEYAKLQ
jgi:eukaryotic-like serine/threonine-protein kinase